MALELVLSAVAGLLIAFPVVREAVGTRNSRSVSGVESLLGMTGRVLPSEDADEPPSWVLVRGERWRARSSAALQPDAWVKIDAVQAMELVVSPSTGPPTRERAAEGSRLLRALPALGLAVWVASAGVAWFAEGSFIAALITCPAAALLLLLCLGGFTGAT